MKLGNTDGEIGGLTISAQSEPQALRDKCEEFADDVPAGSAGVFIARDFQLGRLCG